MLRIRITALQPGSHSFHLEPDPAELDLDPEWFADIQVDVRLDYQVNRVLASFKARTTVTLECDRTLQLFDQVIEGGYQVLFAAPEVLRAEEEEAFDDVRVLHASDQEIDLTEAVRDTLLLAIPIRRVAPGAEGVEIPTRFGAPGGEEADVDPRWEALRKLRGGGGA